MEKIKFMELIDEGFNKLKEGKEEWGKVHDKVKYDRMLIFFINTLNKRGEEYYKKNYNMLTWKDYEINHGKRFDKVIHENSVYCFVEKKTGDIYKPSSWSVAAKGVRANLFDKDSWKKTDVVGAWLYRG